MAVTTAKVICLIWMLSMNDGLLTQAQSITDNISPYSSQYIQEFSNGNDPIEMGRTAAEDMGALMASPPIQVIPSNQRLPPLALDNYRRQFFSQNYLFPSLSQVRNSDVSSNPQYVCTQYVVDPRTMIENQGRSSKRTVDPKSTPLVPLLPSTNPLGGLGGLPLVPPLALPIIQALLPIYNLGRQRLLPPPTLLPTIPRLTTIPTIPGLPTTPRLPKISPLTGITLPPGLPLGLRSIGRSSFTPNSYKVPFEPLVLYV